MLMWKTLLQKNKLTHCFAVRKFVSATIPSRDVQKPQPSKVPSKDSHNPKEKTIGEKLKETMKVYGVTATLFHSTVYVCSLSSVYACVCSGLDAPALLSSWGFDPTMIPDGAGELAAAWCLTALSGPGRGVITVLGTPVVAQWWKRRVQQNKREEV